MTLFKKKSPEVIHVKLYAILVQPNVKFGGGCGQGNGHMLSGDDA